jgi:hypothetical protein
VAALLLTSVLALLGGPLARWAAAGLFLALLPSLWTLVRPFAEHGTLGRWTRRLGDHLPHLILFVAAIALLGELALAHPPASRDHGIHYFQTHVLAHELIPAGRTRGWSDAFNSGYPFGDNYPVFGYLWVAGLHLLSFGAISLRASYALGLLAIWVIALWGIWKLAAMISTEVQARAPGKGARAPDDDSARVARRRAAWAGCIAALLWLLDPGASREGGWVYLMFHGVWPQMLSTALWIASLSLTFAALRRPSPRSLALAALALGGSVLAHPFGLLTAVCSFTAWPVVLWATGSLRRLPGGAIRWWLLIHGVAGLLAIWWVVGFLDSAGAMNRSPVAWHTLGALSTSALRGELFENHIAWVGPLAVVGGIVSLRKGGALAWMCATLLCGMLILGSEAAVTVLRLDLIVSAFKNLQFPRYAIALKPIWCALAGIGGASLITFLRGHWRRSSPEEVIADRGGPAGTRRAKVALAVLCFAAPFSALLADLDRLASNPVGGVHTLEGSIHADHERAIRETLERELASLEDRPMKVAFLRHGMSGGTYPLYAIADVGARVALDGHVPAVNYRRQLKSRTPKALRSMGVTHVIWDRPLEKRDRALAKALEEISPAEEAGFGGYHVARLPDTGTPPSPDLRAGQGEVKIAERHTERYVFELSDLDVDRPGTLNLAIGEYTRWRATDQDGRVLESRAVRLAGGVPGIGIKLPPGPRSRTITLEYVESPNARWSVWVSLIALAIVLLACISRRELELATRIHPPIVQRISWITGFLALTLIVGLLWKRTERKVVATWEPVIEALDLSRDDADAGPPTLEHDLVMEGDWMARTSNPRACDPMLGRNALHGCNESSMRARVSMVYRKPYLYRCARVQVPAKGSLELRFEGIDEQATVVGFVARLTAGRRGGEGLQFRVSGKSRFQTADKARRRLFHTPPDAHEGTVLVELTNDFAWTEDVCVSAATVR